MNKKEGFSNENPELSNIRERLASLIQKNNRVEKEFDIKQFKRNALEEVSKKIGELENRRESLESRVNLFNAMEYDGDIVNTKFEILREICDELGIEGVSASIHERQVGSGGMDDAWEISIEFRPY